MTDKFYYVYTSLTQRLSDSFKVTNFSTTAEDKMMEQSFNLFRLYLHRDHHHHHHQTFHFRTVPKKPKRKCCCSLRHRDLAAKFLARQLISFGEIR